MAHKRPDPSAITLTSVFLLILPVAICIGSSNARSLEDPEIPRGLLGAVAADTNDIVNAVSDTLMTLRPEGVALRVPYYGNRLLDASYTDVVRAIVVIHGTLRNADQYYQSIVDAATGVPGALQNSLIIAPQFLTEPDLDEHHLSEDILYWAYMGWRRGNQSLDGVDHPRPARISSYAVVDTIVYRIAARNPNLQEIVVVGHSAGGQLTNRYAAGNRIQQIVNTVYGVSVRYIVSNPSSYVYFNEERWVEGSSYAFEVPDSATIADCPTYDDYPYGLRNPNEYMNVGDQVLRAQYPEREVIYLLGAQDTDPNSYYLDKDCPAMLEGSNRLERGMVYANHLIDFFGSGIFDVHKIAVVPGVGHDQHGMFTSECGVYHLFDYGLCQSVPPSGHWLDVTTTLLRAVDTKAASWGDFDSDGDPDLFLAGAGSADLLIGNIGNGNFYDATQAPLKDGGLGVSSAWGDYDNDGRPDLYLVNWRSSNRLFRNKGLGTFEDRTLGPLGIVADCADAGWVDFDNDRDLDLFVTRTNGQTNLLLRNDGENGFTDATTNVLANPGNNRSAAWGDYDNDGDQDVYLSTHGPNKLLRNNGGTFTDVTSGPLGDGGNSSSGSWGDFDNDGDLDLYLVNRGSSNKLFRNDGGGVFQDATSPPLNMSATGRSAAWGDYDNDGRLDLYVAVSGSPNKLFRNEGGGAFADSTEFPLDDPGDSYSSAWADFDKDGDLDLYVANNNGSNRMIRNELMTTNHWIEFDFVGTASNVSGIGARVRVVAGGLSQIRQIGGDAGYVSQNSSTVEFGLGTAAGVDTLEIRWPSGIRQVIVNVAGDRYYRMWESDQPAGNGEIPGLSATRLAGFPNPARGLIRIRYETEEPGPVRLSIHDLTGGLVTLLRSEQNEPKGIHWTRWDGTTTSGRNLPPGVYFCRLIAGGGRWTLPLVRVD